MLLFKKRDTMMSTVCPEGKVGMVKSREGREEEKEEEKEEEEGMAGERETEEEGMVGV